MPTAVCKWCGQELFVDHWDACPRCHSLYDLLSDTPPGLVEKMILEISVNRFMTAKSKEK